ncbi:MAG: glycosyltransferase family 2 protein [Tannerella sp.]|jgi:GT2 family glycosyltransferase|nr:glycosyltransferase family 2 protein [Tannerella sp.]
MKKISVIILNWNGRELLECFLPAVLAHTPADIAEIVVADNGSDDDSVEVLKKLFPTVRRLVFDRNYGFAEGYNRALAETQTDYTVLLNSDVEVTHGWLDAPLALLETDKTVAAVQPKILSYKNRNRFEYAGAAGGFIDIYGYPYCRGRVMSEIEDDAGQYDQQADILWATGACLFVKTELYRQVGGLDSVFFAHQEEIDLCWRLRSRGYRVVCTPQSVVYHVGAATLNYESPHKTFLNFRNNLLCLFKNLPEADLKRVMLIRLMLDIIAAVKFLLEGHLHNALAVYRARREYRRLKSQYISVRRENLNKTTLAVIPEVRRKCLLLDYYLKSKHKFSEL